MITTKHIEKELSIQIIGIPDEKIKTNKINTQQYQRRELFLSEERL